MVEYPCPLLEKTSTEFNTSSEIKTGNERKLLGPRGGD